ncbi:MAG: squalene--hopene cyclase [Pirellulales bacterium]
MNLLGISFWNSLRALSAFSLVLWALTVVFSFGVIILLRSRWGQSRPIHRYSLLSLLAHLFLACVATSIQLISGPLGMGDGPPVRVRLLAGATETTTQAIATPQEAPLEEPVVEPAQEAAAEPPQLEPPELAPERPEPEPISETKPPVLPHEPLPQQELPEATPKPPESLPVEQQPLPPVLAPVEPSPKLVSTTREQPAATPAAAQLFADRQSAGRLQVVQEQGGSFATEQAVSAALDWLAFAQSSDGRWDAIRWDAGRETFTLQENRDNAGRKADTAVTALALLAYLGAGHSHADGSYRETVGAGLDFLLRSQTANGNLMGESTRFAQTYSHSMATFALAETLALTNDGRLRPAVERAVAHLLSMQNRTTGGWRYRSGERGDLSQLGWVVLALRSAELAGVTVPQRHWDGIEQFLRLVQHGPAGGMAFYQPGGPPSPTMTVEALYCRQILGHDFSAPYLRASLAESLADVRRELPGSGRPNLYYWYYGSLALHHARLANLDASQTWEDWNEAMKRELLALQVTDGDHAGSWSPSACIWGGYGGRVYATAVAAMCLEVYYRYAPNALATDPWVAARPVEAPQR